MWSAWWDSQCRRELIFPLKHGLTSSRMGILMRMPAKTTKSSSRLGRVLKMLIWMFIESFWKDWHCLRSGCMNEALVWDVESWRSMSCSSRMEWTLLGSYLCKYNCTCTVIYQQNCGYCLFLKCQVIAISQKKSIKEKKGGLSPMGVLEL